MRMASRTGEGSCSYVNTNDLHWHPNDLHWQFQL